MPFRRKIPILCLFPAIDGTTRQEMIEATKNLGKLKTKYGTYFVFGNHDKGYYGSAHRGFSADDLIKELNNNGIKVLMDESVLINDFYFQNDHPSL